LLLKPGTWIAPETTVCL